MIERDKEYGGMNVYCDKCSYSEYVDEDDWSEMIAIIRKRDWAIVNFEGNWRHHCASCKV